MTRLIAAWRAFIVAHRAVIIGVIAGVSFFAMSACWSFANPLMAGPDEQAHVIYAYAIDHGQPGTPINPPSPVFVNFRVPASIAHIAISGDCWRFRAEQSALCSPPWDSHSRLVSARDYVGHYPPLYYVIVGLGGFVSNGKTGIYAMRLVSDALVAVLCGLAFFTIARWTSRRGLLVGVYVALTPMTYFLSGVVNPSGPEVMSTIALVVSLGILALDHYEQPPRALIILIGIESAIAVSLRGLSPLWVAIIAALFVIFAGPRRALHLLRSSRDVQVVTAIIAVVGAVAVVWISTQGTLNVLSSGYPLPPHADLTTAVTATLHYSDKWLSQSVGVLGWLDTDLSPLIYDAWYVAVPLILLAGLWRATNIQRTALVALTLASVVLPIAIITRQALRLQVILWQGRYSLPLMVAVVVMASAVALRPRRQSWFVRVGGLIILATLGAANVWAFMTNMKRYAVGISGRRDFWNAAHRWDAPGGDLMLLVTYGVITALVVVLLSGWWCRTPSPWSPSTPVYRDAGGPSDTTELPA